MRLHYHNKALALSALSLLSSGILSAEGLGIVISEIADQGTGADQCNGEDWIEFQNVIDTTVDLTGWKVYDDNGPDDPDAWIIPEGTSIDPGAFWVVCRNQDFLFGIGGDDTITIADSSGVVVDAVGLPGIETSEVHTLALFENEDPKYQYTSIPTPGEANVASSAPLSLEEQWQKDNELRDAFFDMEGEFGKVIDIDVTIGEEQLSIIREHPNWEEWVDFDGFTVTSAGDAGSGTVLASSSPGNIRTKGQSTNIFTACMGLLNAPFNVKLETPFMGLEKFYLRNHLYDPSYMRDHAASTILKEFGLPYMRTRPARLFMNGEYIGFYTVTEPPDDGPFMQRSFGDFDPDKTAIYKMKTLIQVCPFDHPESSALIMAVEPEFDPEGPVPDPLYFEAGRLKDDVPVLMDELQCNIFMPSEALKDQPPIAHYWYQTGNKDCGQTMVDLGRVDRKFGPKATEDTMVNFLNEYFYNIDTDLSAVIDVDDWLKNIALYVVLLLFDTIIDNINNWYVATTNGGEGDWKIVQWDHNNMMGSYVTPGASASCPPKRAFFPILRPTKGPVEETGNQIISRLLNNDMNMDKYIGYISELVDILSDENGVVSDLYDYGHAIKEYIVDDPLNKLTVEEYESRELGDDIENYGVEGDLPLLKTLRFRVQQVKEQVEAIEAGTLPRNGEYDPRDSCPDWRNPGVDIPTEPTTLSEDCTDPTCFAAAGCYGFCTPEGEVNIEAIPDCAAFTPNCDSCFPHSPCGSATDVDITGTFVPNEETCGDDLAAVCEPAAPCFSHITGLCAFDGSFLNVACQEGAPACQACFPYSRCGSGDLPAMDDSNMTAAEDVVTADNGEGVGTGEFTPNDDTCGTGFELCADAAPCFDHDMGICAEDGSFTNPMCDDAVACKQCYPNSRCGSAGSADNDSGMFVPNDDTCGAGFELCADANTCFNHDMGLCAEDGSFSNTLCDQAVDCAPCYPNSRCGSSAAAGEPSDTGVFTPNDDTCSGPEFELCEAAAGCFDHSTGACGEDGNFTSALCDQSVACKPCFPNSRCGSVATTTATDEVVMDAAPEEDVAEDEGEEPEPKEEDPVDSEPEDDSGGAGQPVVLVSFLSVAVLSLSMMAVVFV